MSAITDQEFQEIVWQHYARAGRHDLPWRQPDPDGHFDPYKILVSEIMLQQTQVRRVLPKYHAFLTAFSTIASLAAAPLAAVLIQWSGLGYNRRAKFLWQAAQAVVHEHQGVMPSELTSLVALPGIGVNTAGAIRSYAFNAPSPFIETNIRTVFIHHYFADARDAVADKDVLALVIRTLPADRTYREWFWALMDYGSYIKQSVGNVSRASKSYAKQSTFQGSRRQIRGQVIRLLTAHPRSLTALQQEASDERLETVLADLVKEGMILVEGETYRLADS